MFLQITYYSKDLFEIVFDNSRIHKDKLPCNSFIDVYFSQRGKVDGLPYEYLFIYILLHSCKQRGELKEI